MAWVFELAIECGQEPEVAATLNHHFDGFAFSLANGTPGSCLCQSQEMTQDQDGNWWKSIPSVLQGEKAMRQTESSHSLEEVARISYGSL